MGIVGPPTPVGMATQQLTHSSHAGMQGGCIVDLLLPWLPGQGLRVRG